MGHRGLVVCFLWCVALTGSGCASSAAVQARIDAIRDKYGVTVVASNPLSRCYLFGNLPGLLDRIDADLAQTPAFFRQRIGPVIVEESFLDNRTAYPLPFLVRGYVNLAEADAGCPIHIKNRSVLEKVLLFAPRDDELFLHEATHSFELNVRRQDRPMWAAFVNEFRAAQPGGSGQRASRVTAAGYALALSLMPPLAYLRPRGMPSLYAAMGHYEDVAETHCYLRRHRDGLEELGKKDPVLPEKCRVLERFTSGRITPEGR